jgi:hypothetical protein
MDNRIFCGIPAPNSAGFNDVVTFCQQNSSQILSSGSFIFCEIAGNLGFDAALRVVYERGGTELYLSKRAFSQYGIDIDDKAIDKIKIVSGNGDRVVISSAFGLFQVLRGIAIRNALLYLGANQVAQQFGVSSRCVRRIKNEKGECDGVRV